MGKFDGFLNNLSSGALNPKGNLADYRHASKLFVADAFRLAPKAKFLYHVAFTFGPMADKTFTGIQTHHKLEAGMLVKTVDLPKYSVAVDTRKKYNRVKHTQTSISYDPITITFHDDNMGVTTALMEAYYRYYFRDAKYGSLPQAYSKLFGDGAAGDNTYMGPERNKFRYGLDNEVTDPFFTNIQISQLTRKTYTTYTLVNPILEAWQHDTADASDGAGTMQNTMTVKYETVWYDRGPIEAGVNGDPKGFGDPAHYDSTPSPISLAGGGGLGLGGTIGGIIDLYQFATTGKGFNNPLSAGLAAANLIGNIRDLSSDGLKQEGFSLLKGAIGAAAGTDVSGVANTVFPKTGGKGSFTDLALGVAAVGGITALSNVTSNSSAASIESAAKVTARKAFQSAGNPGGINEFNDWWGSQPESSKQNFRNQVTGT